MMDILRMMDFHNKETLPGITIDMNKIGTLIDDTIIEIIADGFNTDKEQPFKKSPRETLGSKIIKGINGDQNALAHVFYVHAVNNVPDLIRSCITFLELKQHFSPLALEKYREAMTPRS
jgi:hypothetical protein